MQLIHILACILLTLVKSNNVLRDLPNFSYAGYKRSETDTPDLNEHNSVVFDVTNFGANGNDQESDLTAIRAAVDKAHEFVENDEERYAIIFFPEGTYIINDGKDEYKQPEWHAPIEITASRIVLQGVSETKSIIHMPNYIVPKHSSTDNTYKMYDRTFAVRFYAYHPADDHVKTESFLTKFPWTSLRSKRDLHITTITKNAKKGKKQLQVLNGAVLKHFVGKWVQLKFSSTHKSWLNYMLDGNDRKNYKKWIISKEGISYSCKYQIKSVKGNTVELEQPLLIDVKSYDDDVWKLETFVYIEENGVQDLGFVGGWTDPFVHHESQVGDGGWSAFSFDHVVNGWMKNCRFTNWNRQVNVRESSQISIMNVLMDGNPGHMAIDTPRSSFVFVGRCNDKSGHFHTGLGPSQFATGNVAWRVTWPSTTCEELHAHQPAANLIDACSGGLKEGHFGGPLHQYPHHLRDLVFWNFEFKPSHSRTSVLVDNVFHEEIEDWSPAVMVGLHSKEIDNLSLEKIFINIKDFKLISFGKPHPESLFEFQLGERLKGVPNFIKKLRSGKSCSSFQCPSNMTPLSNSKNLIYLNRIEGARKCCALTDTLTPGVWSSYSKCNASCGKGMQSRICLAPDKTVSEFECEGEASRICFVGACRLTILDFQKFPVDLNAYAVLKTIEDLSDDIDMSLIIDKETNLLKENIILSLTVELTNVNYYPTHFEYMAENNHKGFALDLQHDWKKGINEVQMEIPKKAYKDIMSIPWKNMRRLQVYGSQRNLDRPVDSITFSDVVLIERNILLLNGIRLPVKSIYSGAFPHFSYSKSPDVTQFIDKDTNKFYSNIVLWLAIELTNENYFPKTLAYLENNDNGLILDLIPSTEWKKGMNYVEMEIMDDHYRHPPDVAWDSMEQLQFYLNEKNLNVDNEYITIMDVMFIQKSDIVVQKPIQEMLPSIFSRTLDTLGNLKYFIVGGLCFLIWVGMCVIAPKPKICQNLFGNKQDHYDNMKDKLESILLDPIEQPESYEYNFSATPSRVKYSYCTYDFLNENYETSEVYENELKPPPFTSARHSIETNPFKMCSPKRSKHQTFPPVPPPAPPPPSTTSSTSSRKSSLTCSTISTRTRGISLESDLEPCTLLPPEINQNVTTLKIRTQSEPDTTLHSSTPPQTKPNSFRTLSSENLDILISTNSLQNFSYNHEDSPRPSPYVHSNLSSSSRRPSHASSRASEHSRNQNCLPNPYRSTSRSIASSLKSDENPPPLPPRPKNLSLQRSNSNSSIGSTGSNRAVRLLVDPNHPNLPENARIT